MNTRRRRRDDDGSTPAYLDNGGGNGLPRLSVDQLLQLLAGPEVRTLTEITLPRPHACREGNHGSRGAEAGKSISISILKTSRAVKRSTAQSLSLVTSRPD